MTNLNVAVENDEIDLNDLFAQIDESVAVAVEPQAAVEPAIDDLDLSLLLDEEFSETPAEVAPAEAVETTVEEKPTAKKSSPKKAKTKAVEEKPVVDELDGLFDESELDLDSLTLAAEEKPVETEVAKEKPAEKPKKERSPTTYRTTYQNSKRSAVLLDRLGGDTSEIVLEFDDVDLPEQELKEKQEKFLRLLNAQPTITTNGETVQKKVAEKVVILFTMFKNNGRWNEVMYRTFKLLLSDGYISGGKDSNLVKDLLAKPYSIGTARAQAGQMMQLLPLLKIVKEENGRLVPNENSTILARLRSQYFGEESSSKEAA